MDVSSSFLDMPSEDERYSDVSLVTMGYIKNADEQQCGQRGKAEVPYARLLRKSWQ